MKTMTMIIIVAGIVAGAASYSLSRPKPSPVASDAVPLTPPPASHPVREAPAAGIGRIQEPAGAIPDSAFETPAPHASALPNPEDARPNAVAKAVDLLVSNEVSQQQKQAIWNELQAGGELDTVIGELQRRAAENPDAARYPLALGQALLNKITGVKEPQEQAILALQADQNLDAALRLEPANWEAQLLKAAELARWPEALNRGEEVIHRLTTLIEQQETMPPRPEFAHSYVLLGDQYQKSGKADHALAVWRIGIGMFPSDPDLKQRLADAVAR